MEKDTGTILRQLPLGENGLIICWCTEGHGIVRTAARSARKPGSELAGRLDLFHECELLFELSSTGDLHPLKSAALLDARLPLRQDLLKLRLAGYMAQLMMATVEAGEHDAEWHRLIAGALDYTAQNPPRAAILTHFEKRLATLHGVYSPQIPAHTTLLRHFRKLPAGRDELLNLLA
ncbi:MAG: DNA repair protein RecO [Akkermansia sp.]|nr:DNA repair protein RecO [Akkermansia sp.]